MGTELTDLEGLRNRLSAGRDAIVALGRMASDEEARWKPAPDRWSILEIINHLADIETEDFRVELEQILKRSDDPWPSFDIHDWLVSRRYNEQDPAGSLLRFSRERDQSLAKLSELGEIDLSLRHSGIGYSGEPLAAGDVVSAWVAHDMFHIRQMALLYRDMTEHFGAPYSTAYSGFEV